MKSTHRSVQPATELLRERQAALGLTDEDVAAKVGYAPAAVRMICAGRMELPVNKVAAFAGALEISTTELLAAVLRDRSPELWAVLETLLPLGELSSTEINLVRKIRQAAGERRATPLVLEGSSVIALVVTP